MRKLSFAALAIPMLLFSLACDSSRTDKADTGGVLLTISDFDGLPFRASVNGELVTDSVVTIDSITIQSVPLDPTGGTSSLMNVELSSYEVLFSRADTGTRLPPALVRNLPGQVPVNGTETIENLPVTTLEQLDEVPLSDLQFINGGIDSETNHDVILLNLRLRFFGHTLSGDAVDTGPIEFTVEFIP